MRSAAAFAPAHITGFFQIFDNGSTGAGLNPALGAETRVRLSAAAAPKVEVIINGKTDPAPVSRAVIARYAEHLQGSSLIAEHTLAYPIGYGTGMSGAGAFSLSLALNAALGEPLSAADCLEAAVRAEIESGTGLGDVIAQQFHGLMIGLPPYPSRSVEQIPCPASHVVCAFFAPLETGKIIRDPEWKQRINAAGERAMQQLSRDKTAAAYIRLAREFTAATGLAGPEVRKVLEAIPDCSMAMLGQTVYWLTSEPRGAEQALSAFSSQVVSAPLGTRGAHVL